MCVVCEFVDGFYVNFGIGLLIFILNYIVDGFDVVLYFENGVLGVGLYLYLDVVDLKLINVGKEMVIVLFGLSYFDFVLSFGMICGGWIGIVVFGVM